MKNHLPIRIRKVMFDSTSNLTVMRAEAILSPAIERPGCIAEWTIPTDVANQVCELLANTCPAYPREVSDAEA